METITLNLYKFDELSAEAQQKVIKKFLNSDRDYFWGDDNKKTLENDSIVEPTITLKTSFADYVEVNDNMNASSDSSDNIPVLMMVGDCNSDNISYAHKELSSLKTDKEWMKFEHFKCGESKKSSANDCVNTKYYELGLKAGKYSSNKAPDENYRVNGIQYYRLQNDILETDPKAGCFDDGFVAGHTGN